MALADVTHPRPKLSVRSQRPPRRRILPVIAALPLLLLVACGGKSRDNSIEIQGPSLPPLQTVPIRTLEPGPSDTPVATPAPTPTSTPGVSATPVPAPGDATMTSQAGTQKGAPSSFCWSTEEGGPSTCYTHDQQTQDSSLGVKSGEKVVLRISATIPPDEESVRPFRGTRSGYPSQSIEPALETDLTVNLPAGKWSMDLCATWHNRGQPICWLFALNVG